MYDNWVAEQEEREALERIDGLFVGQLSPNEMTLFERAIKQGLARRSYEGPSGFLGVAKVRVENQQ